MSRKLFACLVALLMLILAACGGGGQPAGGQAPALSPADSAAQDYIGQFPDADLIIGDDGYFYPEATRVAWVSQNLDLSDATVVATVGRSGVTAGFQAWDATVLPQGTQIKRHNVEDAVLVVEVDGELRPYLRYVAHS